MTDRNGHATTYTYDSFGNVLTVITPRGLTTTYTWSYANFALGRLTGVQEGSKPATTITYYEPSGLLQTITRPEPNNGAGTTTTTYTYDSLGNVLTVVAPGNDATSSITTTLNYTTDGAYSQSAKIGQPLTVTDNLNHVTHLRSYGLEGEALSVSGSTEPVTNTYDPLYRIKTLKDGNNNTTTYAYNNMGLVSLITMPGGETTQFLSYDNDGNLLQRIDGKAVTTNYLYTDPESQLTDIQYPATTALNIHFAYDSYGRRSSMTDSTGSQSYTYGNLDELLSATTTYTGLSAKTISYAYYPNGSRQTMVTPAGNFSYTYDAAGRPATMTNPFSETTSWAFRNNNWLATQTLANGATATYTHNALGQVTELLNQIGSTPISDFTISYDGVGNRTSVSASGIGTSSLNGSAGFTYDTKNQLLEELSNRYGSFTDDFGFDSSGNPTSFKGTTKSYNSNNQQTATGFTYDSNGNPTAYNGVSLTFDPENRLTAHGSTLTAGYRGDGLRASKQTSSGTSYFLYDGSNPVVELDASGSVSATNSFSPRGVVSRRVSSVSVLYTFDPEGNVAQRTDVGANVLSDYLFDAHGVSLNLSLSEPFGYKAQLGYYTDNETGLQLLTHRYYDPQSGRFLTRDPIGYAGGINLYSYVANNPINRADASGLTGEELALPAAGAFGGAAAALAPYAAAAAPYAAAVVAYGFVLKGAWELGEWTAEQPWNPFTHPAIPDDSYCQPRVIPFPKPQPRSTPLFPPTPGPLGEMCPLVDQTGSICTYQCKDGHRFTVFVKNKGDRCPAFAGR